MKLNERDVHPENNTMHFAIKKGSSPYPGFVGIVLFRDGIWYSMPDEIEMKHPVNNFMWVSEE